jgi:hypothetical protein
MFQKEVRCLGYVSPEEVTTDKENLMAIWECPPPKAKDYSWSVHLLPEMAGLVYITTALSLLKEEKQTFQLPPESKATFQP